MSFKEFLSEGRRGIQGNIPFPPEVKEQVMEKVTNQIYSFVYWMVKERLDLYKSWQRKDPKTAPKSYFTSGAYLKYLKDVEEVKSRLERINSRLSYHSMGDEDNPEDYFIDPKAKSFLKSVKQKIPAMKNPSKFASKASKFLKELKSLLGDNLIPMVSSKALAQGEGDYFHLYHNWHEDPIFGKYIKAMDKKHKGDFKWSENLEKNILPIVIGMNPMASIKGSYSLFGGLTINVAEIVNAYYPKDIREEFEKLSNPDMYSDPFITLGSDYLAVEEKMDNAMLQGMKGLQNRMLDVESTVDHELQHWVSMTLDLLKNAPNRPYESPHSHTAADAELSAASRYASSSTEFSSQITSTFYRILQLIKDKEDEGVDWNYQDLEPGQKVQITPDAFKNFIGATQDSFSSMEPFVSIGHRIKSIKKKMKVAHEEGNEKQMRNLESLLRSEMKWKKKAANVLLKMLRDNPRTKEYVAFQESDDYDDDDDWDDDFGGNRAAFEKGVKWIKANARTKFVHMSKNPVEELKSAGAQSKKSSGKPQGLWGGRGAAWLEWMMWEMPHWKGEHVYTFEIDPEDIVIWEDSRFGYNKDYSGKIIRLKPEQADAFTRQYSELYTVMRGSSENIRQNAYKNKAERGDTLYMDWDRFVKQTRCKGILFEPWHRHNFHLTWYNGVDIPSICIFDPSVIKDWTDVSESVNEETQIDPIEQPEPLETYQEGNYECKKPPYGAKDEEADMLNTVNQKPPLMEQRMRDIFRKRMGLS